MLVLTGYFDNDRIVPDVPVKLPQRVKVKIMIDEEFTEEEKQRRIKIVEELNRLLEESKAEILPDNFPTRLKFRTPEELAL